MQEELELKIAQKKVRQEAAAQNVETARKD